MEKRSTLWSHCTSYNVNKTILLQRMAQLKNGHQFWQASPVIQQIAIAPCSFLNCPGQNKQTNK